jgi:hypothetical protein
MTVCGWRPKNFRIFSAPEQQSRSPEFNRPNQGQKMSNEDAGDAEIDISEEQQDWRFLHSTTKCVQFSSKLIERTRRKTNNHFGQNERKLAEAW